MIWPVGIRLARAACAAPAAPAGGAHCVWGRGCGYASLRMVVVFAALIGAPAAAFDTAAASVSVPSGQPVTLNEILLDTEPGQLWLRLRFVAPQIARSGGAITHDQAAADMDHLCKNLALPYMSEQAIAPERVVISFSDRALPFGVQDAAATQFFEVYRPSGDTCIWEGF